MGIVTSISAGAYHTVALKADGDVWAWGYGGDGEIGDNNPANALVPPRTTIANVVRIEAHGAYHTLARTRSGQISAEFGD
jgi:alpha-tubulin suppressor-like RCC1 family protein